MNKTHFLLLVYLNVRAYYKTKCCIVHGEAINIVKIKHK